MLSLCFEFTVGLLLSQLESSVHASEFERLYTTTLTVANNHPDDATAAPLWFRIGGSNNVASEWFVTTDLLTTGTGYELPRHSKQLFMPAQTLTLVKFDTDIVVIDAVSVDWQNYTFDSEHKMAVSQEDSVNSVNSINSAYVACDTVKIDFVSQSHETIYYPKNCPWAHLVTQGDESIVAAELSGSDRVLPAPAGSTLLDVLVGKEVRTPQIPSNEPNAKAAPAGSTMRLHAELPEISRRSRTLPAPVESSLMKTWA